MKHKIIGWLAIPFLPFFWLSFLMIGMYFTPKELLMEWYAHYKSDKPWGIFDDR